MDDHTLTLLLNDVRRGGLKAELARAMLDNHLDLLETRIRRDKATQARIANALQALEREAGDAGAERMMARLTITTPS